MPEQGYFAHQTAIIDQPCTIGGGTRIWHFSHVMQTAQIGERCNIGQNVVVSPGCTLGNRVKVQNNVSIYTGVCIEDDVFLGPSMVFTNVINPRAFIERKEEYRATLVRRGASVGANATILCGITLGMYCMVGAGSVVTRGVPDFAIVRGNPARIRDWICWCGATLGMKVDDATIEESACAKCGRTYRRNGLHVEELAVACAS